jgi:hypothetical protein
MRTSFTILFILLLPAFCLAGIPDDSLLNVIVGRLLDNNQAQLALISDITYDVVSYEKRTDGDGKVKETKKYIKKVRLDKGPDGKFLNNETIYEYYINGEKQNDADLAKLARERAEKKKKRGGQGIDYDMTRPLKPERREYYDVRYLGLAEEQIDGYDCYMVGIEAKENKETKSLLDTLINAVYYIDTISYNLVRVDFSPARLTSKLMFKLRALDMSVRYEPYDSTLWLPRQFTIKGRGKAALFVGVYFEGEEVYSNPVINSATGKEKE